MPKRPKTTTDPVELQQGFHCLICNLTPDGSLMLPISGEGWPESLKTAIEEEEMAGWVNKDHFILWYLNKGVQFYQTRDGKPITTLADIKRMWAEIRGEVTPKKVQAYLFPQHEDILKKLESTAPLAEGKALETPQRSNEASEEYDVFLKTYKELILETIDLRFNFKKYKGGKVEYEVKEDGVKVTPIDEKLEDIVDRLQRAGQSFRGYKMDNNKLVRSYSTVAEWTDRIKKIKKLEHPLDIKNAILEEMKRQEREAELIPETPQRSNEASEEYDVFLCHASEDKDSFVRPLAQTLRDRGLRVWYDEFSLKLGDGLRESIERGLKKSRYGVIVLSKNFFCKEWPQKELNGLFSLESGEKKILPVWHEVNKKEVTEYSPILANRVAIKTSKGLTDVAEKIIEVACIGAS